MFDKKSTISENVKWIFYNVWWLYLLGLLCLIVVNWLQGSEYIRILNMPPVLNMPGFWICLNICSVFWIYEGSEYQGSTYTRVMNMSLVLNMLVFWIYQSFEYTRIKQGSRYAWTIPEYARLGLNIMSEYFQIWLNMLKYSWVCWNVREYA